MFTIHRFPPFGKRFFRRIRKLVGRGHFSHLWRIVIALASLTGKKSLSKMTTLFENRRTRQAIAHFLTEAEWDAPKLLLDNAIDTLRQLGWTKNESLYLVLDDTQKQKRGKQMDAVSKIFLHAEKVYAKGHTIVGLAFVYRGAMCRPSLGKQGVLWKIQAKQQQT